MNATFVGFPPLGWALEKITGFNESKFKTLLDAIQGQQGLSSDYDRCKQLAIALDENLTAHDILNLLTSIRFLYDRSREWENSQRDLDSALQEFLEFSDLANDLGELPQGIGYQRLRQLLAKNPGVERHRKIQVLTTGLLDLAVDFSSFVDLRPRFKEDRSAVEEFIPVIVLQAAVEHDYGDMTSHVFQLTSSGFSKLRKVLDDIQKKLDALKNDSTLVDRIYSPVDD